MKTLRKYLLIFIISILIFSPTFAKASSERIYSIDTVVDLKTDGTAHITQVWRVDTHSGSEFYIPIENLGNMTLENFSVRDEDGRKFKFVDDWDIDASMMWKTDKCGINYTNSGFELCWGKGTYGEHVYTLEWDYTNAVQGYSDFDGFNIRFVNDNMDPSPERISVVINKTNTDFTDENARIWAFGFGGDIQYYKDGSIQAHSRERLGSGNYVNIMVNFDKGIFKPQIVHDESFSVLEEEAKIGASYEGKYHDEEYYERLDEDFIYLDDGNNLIYQIIGIFPFAVIIALVFYKLTRKEKIKSKVNGIEVNFNPKNYKKINYKKMDYKREIPLNNRLDSMHYIEHLNKKDNKQIGNVMAAYILRWVQRGNLLPTEERKEKGLIFKKEKMEVNLKIMSKPDYESIAEANLWAMFEVAAGENAILEDKEFEKYIKEHVESFKYWIDLSVEQGAIGFYEMGGLEKVDEKKTKANTQITNYGQKLIDGFYGFKRFLKDFTLISERGVKEVELWDEYLIIATLMGMGEEVAKQMENLVPNYVFAENTNQNITTTYANYYLANSIIQSANRYARAGHSAYISSTISTSSGGGGGASFGGGGGFSGGGSGGGSR
ncbi:MAG: DUF2207 domain-containing protein [Tissierellia bacterium]|nr:DUF2207 domain-containing protein [Tissierellia bacterium]